MTASGRGGGGGEKRQRIRIRAGALFAGEDAGGIGDSRDVVGERGEQAAEVGDDGVLRLQRGELIFVWSLGRLQLRHHLGDCARDINALSTGGRTEAEADGS